MRYAHTLAFLRCQDQAGCLVALPICQRRITTFEEADPFHLGMYVATWLPCHKHAQESSPGRAVRLTQEALAVVPEHLASASLSEVFLLRHTDRPKPRKEGLASLRIWRPLEDSPHFDLSVDCIEGLTTPGFSVSPLNVVLQRDIMILQTTLMHQTFPSSEDSVPSFKHTVELQTTFSKWHDKERLWARWETAVRFSVINHFYFLQSPLTDSDDPLPNGLPPASPYPMRITPSGLPIFYRKAPEIVQASRFDELSIRTREVAEASFAIPADQHWDKEDHPSGHFASSSSVEIGTSTSPMKSVSCFTSKSLTRTPQPGPLLLTASPRTLTRTRTRMTTSMYTFSTTCSLQLSRTTCAPTLRLTYLPSTNPTTYSP